MGKMFRFSIFCLLIILLLKPTFSFVNSVGNKGKVHYSKNSKDINSNVVEESVDDFMIAKKVIMDVPLINQMPEFINGCEVTSLTMLLNYNNIKISKTALAKEIKRDTTPMVKDSSGNIIKWGDPNDGFVGDLEGDNGSGYSIYPKALLPLANKYLNNNAIDLTGETTKNLIKSLSEKKPILVWITTDFAVPKEFMTWTKNNKKIKATFDEHCIILTGYDEDNFYYNDPLNLGKNKAIDKETFEKVWDAMGRLALGYN